jgi:hypothetical protein
MLNSRSSGEMILILIAEENAAIWRQEWARAVTAHDDRRVIDHAADQFDYWLAKSARMREIP